MAIYSFSPFGYEGALVQVEVDLRRGIPAVDIVGLADSAVKETRERTRSAIMNSGFEYPQERVLISLSPADLKKEGAGFDLPIALGILSEKDDYPRSQDAKVLVMGELELSGSVRPVKGIYPALSKAVENGIKYAIVPEYAEKAVPYGIKVYYVDSLNDAYNVLKGIDEYEVLGNGEFDVEWFENTEPCEPMKIEFQDIEGSSLDDVKGLNGLKYAMAVAVAGRHNMITLGAPGCGKTIALQNLPEIMPKLLPEERQSVTRIFSLAGLMHPNEGFKTARPFRIPHQTASLEGIYGGGVNCRPGEITLAHNGVLFLDEAAEFRSSVLQMLRVPLERGNIILSRAGRSTVFPANFQLFMATNPCPCGNLGNPDKGCLCSEKSVELYWRKFSAPLLDRVAIRYDCNDPISTDVEYTVEKIREMIKKAWEVQYKRQHCLNQELSSKGVQDFCELESTARVYLDEWTEKNNASPRTVSNIIKVAQTISDMSGFDRVIDVSAVKRAIELHQSTPLMEM